MSAARSTSRIGYILRSYPRLSQTFILHEILALEALGVELEIFAITDPREPMVQPDTARVRAPVSYLAPAAAGGALRAFGYHLRALALHPIGYLRALLHVLRRPALDRGYHASSRWECLLFAVYLVGLLRAAERRGAPIRQLHAHFAHDPALIALLVREMTGLPFSISAHARDLLQLDPEVLRERVAAATSLTTCCAANVEYLHAALPSALHAKVGLIHHGVDLRGFQPGPRLVEGVDPPLVLAVGRLVAKKGFADLIQACARLKAAEFRFRLAIYGEGPLAAELEQLIDTLDLGDSVQLRGACTQPELLPMLQRADIFALTPYVTDEGDRDGVPNVLVEAMACGLPVLSTAVAGIPELVTSGENGLLAPARDVERMAVLLAALLDDAELRAALGGAARQTVVAHFDLRAAARRLASLLGATDGAGEGAVVAAGGVALLPSGREIFDAA